MVNSQKEVTQDLNKVLIMSQDSVIEKESVDNDDTHEEPTEEKTDTQDVEMTDNEESIKKVVSGNSDNAKKKRRPRRKRKNINVKTLFVGGLPMDAKPREIYLMFRKFTGYQGSILKMYGKEGKTATPVAFVTFETREQAEAAKSELHGLRFDEQVAKTLKIEFAKSNTKDAANAISSRAASCTAQPQNEFRVIHPPTVPLGDTATSQSVTKPAQQTAQPAWPPVMPPAMFYDMSGNMFPPPPSPLPVPVYSPVASSYPPGYPPAAAAYPQMPPTYPPVHPAYPTTTPAYPAPPPPAYSSVTPEYQPPAPEPPAPPPTTSQNSSSRSNPVKSEKGHNDPCTTLFVANLCHQAKEDELVKLFSDIPCFCRVRMLHNKGMKPVAFVQYSELSSAVQAKTTLNGKSLPSAETGGIRIEYAKKDMGGLPS